MQKFWKMSAAGKNWEGNTFDKMTHSFLENNKASIGWTVYLNKGLKTFDENQENREGRSECFEENVKKEFKKFGKPTNSSSQIRDFYFLEENDIIFLLGRKSYSIAAIGIITKPYYFDKELGEKIFVKDCKWTHFVDVNWFFKSENDPIVIVDINDYRLFGENVAIKEIKNKKTIGQIIDKAKNINPNIDFSKYIENSSEIEIRKLIEEVSEEECEKILGKINSKDIEVTEGKEYLRETVWRSRNRKIIEIKKLNSDYTCEICGFNFEKKYGEIGKHFIVVHHLKPIGLRKKAEKTTLDDLALVCENCHRMLHKKDCLTIKKLKTILLVNKSKNQQKN